MVKFTNEEFDNIILKSYDEMEIEITKGNNGYSHPWSWRIYNFMNFKYTDKQFKKLVDYTFEEPFDPVRLLKISVLIHDEDFPKKCISLKAYEYYVKSFVENLKELGDFENMYSDLFYFRARLYSDTNTKREMDLEEITMKYMDKLNFTDSKYIKDLMILLKSRCYKYRGYNNALAFNNYLEFLEAEIDLDVEEFKLEDRIEDYVWKNQ